MLFNAALIIYNSIGEYETRPDAALGLCSGLELWLGVESSAVARPSPIRTPSTCIRPNLDRTGPYFECNLDARAAVSYEPEPRAQE